MVVNVLGSAGGLCPGPPEVGVQIFGRVEVEAQTGEVRAQGQRHQVSLRLGGSDKRQQTNHSELVFDHTIWNIRHFS